MLNINENHYAFSILVLTSPDKPGEYLLAYDKRWRINLFPYLRTKDSGDAEAVRNHIADVLGIAGFKISKTVTEEMTKVSVSANLTKTYQHTFYFIEFKASGTPFESVCAKVGGIRYKWHTIDAMKCDRRQWRTTTTSLPSSSVCRGRVLK